MTKYLLFGALLLGVSQWLQITTLLSNLNKTKTVVSVVVDEALLQLIRGKTGVEIKTIRIHESSRLFGMMLGIPTRPQLILSRNLYESFDQDELEYVVLHEAGHYKLGHMWKELLFGLVLMVLGSLVLYRYSRLIDTYVLAGVLGVVFALFLIQLGRVHEYQADAYTLQQISDPNGMIQATYKFRAAHPRPQDGSLIQRVFYRGVPYGERIGNAQEEIARRKSQ